MFCTNEEKNTTTNKHKNRRLQAEQNIFKTETDPEEPIEMNLKNLFELNPDKTGRIEKEMSTEGEINRMKSHLEQEEISPEEIEEKEIE